MKGLIITKQDLNLINTQKNKILLLNSLNDIANEVLIDGENRENIKNLLYQRLKDRDQLNSFNDDQKRKFIDLGLTIALDLINTQVIKEEQKGIQKRLMIKQSVFLDVFSNQLNELEQRIENNKSEFIEFKINSKELSLNQLANKINEYHNPEQTKAISEEDIDQLLNGGIMNF